MKKTWLVVLVVLLVAVAALFVIKKPGEKQATSGKIVVVVNNGPKETDTVKLRDFKKKIARFNEVYPDIEIRWTDRNYSPDSFATSMAGGTAEDVSSVYATEGYIADRGYALDMTDMINNWEHRDQLNVEMLQPFTRNGRYNGFPEFGYIMALAYNKSLFRQAGISEPPNTWEEFVEVAKKLTNRQKGIAGFGILGRGAEAGWGFLNWVWQAGGDFQREENGQWKAVFHEPEAVKGLEFIRDLRWEHDVLQSNLLVVMEDLMPMFAAGQLGMMMVTGTTNNVPNKINQFGINKDDVGIALLPAGPAGRANQMGGAYLVINPNSPKEVQEAAFKWITWSQLYSWDPEIIKEQAKDLRAEGRVGSLSILPIFSGEIDRKAREVMSANLDVFIDFADVQEAAKYIRPEPPFFSQQLYSEYLGPVVEEVLTKKNTNPAKLLADAAKSFQERFLSQVN